MAENKGRFSRFTESGIASRIVGNNTKLLEGLASEIGSILSAFDHPELDSFVYEDRRMSVHIGKSDLKRTISSSVENMPLSAPDSNAMLGLEEIPRYQDNSVPNVVESEEEAWDFIDTGDVVEKEQRASSASSSDRNLIVTSSLPASCYLKSSPDAEPYVKVGDMVQEGQVIALLETMKVFSEVTAPRSGKIVKIFVNHADLVEEGTPMFEIETTES